MLKTDRTGLTIQQPLPQGRFQGLEGVDQISTPDGGKLGGRKGIAHAGVLADS
jgi:hypothetical protein